MSGYATDLRGTAREVTGYWWVWLLAGIAWTGVALVILQFDDASITTVGALTGVLFVFAGLQNLIVAVAPETESGPLRLLSGLFAVLFGASAIVCFVSPVSTFAGLADMLGFLFLIVGVWWIVRAFLERPVNSLWWLGLVSGTLMTILAFWTEGQFFIEKAYVLLVFAGIWALMEGVANIMRAFVVREAHEEL